MDHISSRLSALAAEMRTSAWKDVIQEGQTPDEAVNEYRLRIARAFAEYLNSKLAGLTPGGDWRITDSPAFRRGDPRTFGISIQGETGYERPETTYYYLQGRVDFDDVWWGWEHAVEYYDEKGRLKEDKKGKGTEKMPFDDTSPKAVWAALWGSIDDWDCWG